MPGIAKICRPHIHKYPGLKSKLFFYEWLECILPQVWTKMLKSYTLFIGVSEDARSSNI